MTDLRRWVTRTAAKRCLSRACIVLPVALSMVLNLSAQSVGYAHAEQLVREHQWDEGLAAVETLLKTDPHNLKELNLAGLALTGKGDVQQANEYFRRALRVDAGFVPALKNLGVNEYNQRELDAAQKHLQAASLKTQDDPVIHLYLGEIAYRRKQYDRAVTELLQAKPFVARSENVAAHLATSFLQTGKKDAAIEIVDRLAADKLDDASEFQLAIELAQQDLPDRAIPLLSALDGRVPDSYEIGFDLALVSDRAKDYARSIQAGNELIRRGHETAELDSLLAKSYEADGQSQPAVDALRRAIALDPQDESNYLDFATLCMNHRSYEAAMKVLTVGLQVHPKSESLTFMRGVLYGMQDDYDLAEKDFQRAADLAPETNLGFIGLGVTYLEKGNAAQAIQTLHERLRRQPNDASLLYLLAEALMRTGAVAGTPEYKEAQTSLEKSVKLNPDLCLPRVLLGTIYLDEDRAAEAVVQLEKARSIDPKERAAYSHLSVAYRRTGQMEKSKETLNALREMIERDNRALQPKLKPGSEGEAASPSSSSPNQ